MNLAKEKEYYELLLKRCLKIQNSLFIFCHKINLASVQSVVEMAKAMGVADIHIEVQDDDALIKKLKQISNNDIETDEYFKCSKWNEYAKKNAAFLIFKTELPGYMDSVDKEKLVTMMRVKRKNQGVYKKLQLSYEISWCIAILPNKLWADTIFPNQNNAEEKLFEVIVQSCMVEGKQNSISLWDNHITTNNQLVAKLNDLKIKRLSYNSAKGTDLQIGLSKDAVWQGAAKGDFIVNMPTYETFTIPDSRDINGVVYSTRPLIYNGILIEDFWFRFENGKIIDLGAVKGEEALQSLVCCTEGANTLGEVALVDIRSPISHSGIVFGNTLLDENASCHLALGNAFPKCMKDFANLSKEDLQEQGFNFSDIHVDFMIGDDTLTISALTYDGREVPILINGEIVL